MPATSFRNRQAVSLENEHLRVTVLREGGHIAEIFDKHTGVSPLWIPPWPSIEPSTYDPHKHPELGPIAEAKLLSGIMGHNLCLDIFGGPSPEEAVAGLTPHGEGSMARYEFTETSGTLTQRADFPLAQLLFERSIELRQRWVRIRESIENLTACDRPIGWTQHVSLGPPFLESGTTQIRASVTRSRVYDGAFGTDAQFQPGAEFEWPLVPLMTGGAADLRLMSAAPASEYTAHLADPRRTHQFLVAFAPAYRLAFAYLWKREDFPWLGIWRENCSRKHLPWSGRSLVLGLEFGVSPMPESRREMVDRSRLFDVPTYRWLAAKQRLQVEYCVQAQTTDRIPETIDWPVD